jgi:hypothetical protein
MPVAELRLQLFSALSTSDTASGKAGAHIAGTLDSAEEALLLAALNKQVEANLRKFFAQLDLQTDVKALMKRYEAGYSRMWEELGREYFPATRAEFDHRSKHVLIIAPGFGVKQNPAQINCLQQAGYQVRLYALYSHSRSYVTHTVTHAHDITTPQHLIRLRFNMRLLRRFTTAGMAS